MKDIIVKSLLFVVFLNNIKNMFLYQDNAVLFLVIAVTVFAGICIFNFKWDDDSLRFYVPFFLYCFFLYLLWAIIVPFDSPPDEFNRYLVPQFIYENGKLPCGLEDSVRIWGYGFSYAIYPNIPSIISALFMKIGATIFGIEKLYIYARLTSILSGVGVVIMGKKIAGQLFNSNTSKLFVISISLLPQFTYLSSYMNNDTFAVFSVSIVIYGMLIGCKNNWNAKSCIIMGVGGSMCALSYYNSLGIIVVAFLYATVLVIGNKSLKNKLIFYLQRVGIVASTMLALTSFFFIRNAINLDGDFLGLKTRNIHNEMFAIDELKMSLAQTPYKSGVSLFGMLTGEYMDSRWLGITKVSFLGMFGGMNDLIRLEYYTFFEYVIKIGIVCLIIGIIINKKKDYDFKNKMWFYISMVLMCIITVSLSLYYSYFVDFQPQGRYLMPMLISLTILFISGWEIILEKIPLPVRKLITICMIMGYVLINVSCIYYVV